jgi:hypothetical protein
MKTMNLSEMGVKEMSLSEMKETDGGLLLVILAVCATALLLSSCGGVDTYAINEEARQRALTNPVPDSTCIDQSIH